MWPCKRFWQNKIKYLYSTKTRLKLDLFFLCVTFNHIFSQFFVVAHPWFFYYSKFQRLNVYINKISQYGWHQNTHKLETGNDDTDRTMKLYLRNTPQQEVILKRFESGTNLNPSAPNKQHKESSARQLLPDKIDKLSKWCAPLGTSHERLQWFCSWFYMQLDISIRSLFSIENKNSWLNDG